MRIYARHVSGIGELRIDVLPDVPIQARPPDPDSPTIAVDVLVWRHAPLLINGQPGDLAVELGLLSGQLCLIDAQGQNRYFVIKGRDSDRLRLQLYQYLLGCWYELAKQRELSRNGLDMIERTRSQIYRLEDGLEQPDSFMYQFL